MKILIAIDSFKGSLSSKSAASAIKEGILSIFPKALVISLPIADGGEGTVDALTEGLSGKKETVEVTGPLGEKIKASYGIVKETTAIMEIASAAGITLVPENLRNPLHTTTYGVGEMIKDAISKGCRSFLIGIGGSATNDGGVGMLSSLGFEFLDENGEPIALGAKGLQNLKSIRNDKVIPELSECTFSIACDVANPLCGKLGCSHIFAPQKGADEKMIADMDAWLENYASLVKTLNEKANKDAPGAGAAGGLGFAFSALLGATLQKGIDLILEEINLEHHAKDCDFVITGEGKLDSQTAMGKAPLGVARLAKKHGVPVIAFAGSIGDDAKVLNEQGIDAFFSITNAPCTLSDAMDEKNAYNNMKNTAEQVFRVIEVIRGSGISCHHRIIKLQKGE